MMLGLWKNVEELEANINLPELEAILSEAQRKDIEDKKFLASLQGIDLDGGEDAQDKVDRIKKRLAAKAAGRSEDALELEELGIQVESG